MARSKVTKTSHTSPRSKAGATLPKPANASEEDTGQTKVSSPPADTEVAHPNPPGDLCNGKPPPATSLLAAADAVDSAKAHAADVAEKIKELVRLAQEQGYLTYG